MLHDFVIANRSELITRCRDKVARRLSPAGAPDTNGVPLFLQQLVDTLRREYSTPNAVTQGPTPTTTPIGRGAALHGAMLLRSGYTVGQVVHDYGDVCQAVTELAAEHGAIVAVDDFRILNRCLDDAIAGAVTAFVKGNGANDGGATSEQRRLISVAVQGFSAIQTGRLGINGSTATTVARTLSALAEALGAGRLEA
jgi:hypothetical protein